MFQNEMFECSAHRAFLVVICFLTTLHFGFGVFLTTTGLSALLEKRCELGLHPLCLICGLSTVLSTLVPPLLLLNVGVVATVAFICFRNAPLVQAEHNMYIYGRNAFKNEIIEVLRFAEAANASQHNNNALLLHPRMRRWAKWYDDDQLSLKETRRCDRQVAERSVIAFVCLLDTYAVLWFAIVFMSGKGPTILEHYWEVYTHSGKGSTRYFFRAISQMDIPKSRPGSRASGSGGDLYYSDVFTRGARSRRRRGSALSALPRFAYSRKVSQNKLKNRR